MKRYWHKQYLLHEISTDLDKTMGVNSRKNMTKGLCNVKWLQIQWRYVIVTQSGRRESSVFFLCIVLFSIPEKDFEQFMTLLPKDKSVQLVVYCNDIKFGTSTKWASKAAAYGYTNMVIYSEGFSAWKAQHMPTAPLDDSH